MQWCIILLVDMYYFNDTNAIPTAAAAEAGIGVIVKKIERPMPQISKLGGCTVRKVKHYQVLQSFCNLLQHTQHTVTHCNTLATHLQHTATHCNTMQHTARLISHLNWDSPLRKECFTNTSSCSCAVCCGKRLIYGNVLVQLQQLQLHQWFA